MRKTHRTTGGLLSDRSVAAAEKARQFTSTPLVSFASTTLLWVFFPGTKHSVHDGGGALHRLASGTEGKGKDAM